MTDDGLAVGLSPSPSYENYGVCMLDYDDGSEMWGSSLDATLPATLAWNTASCIASNGSDILVGTKAMGPAGLANIYCFSSGGSLNWSAMANYTTPTGALGYTSEKLRAGVGSVDTDGTDWYIGGFRFAGNG